MSTSGSITFSVTRDDIITEALEQMGMLSEGQSPSADELVSLGRTLNMMVKSWQADGLNLFALQKIYVYLETGKKEYSVGSSTSDHVTSQYNRTTISVDALTGDNSLQVTSISGISNNDYVGIKLSDGTMQWTTINGVPVGNTIVLSSALTGDTVIGNTVFFYTLKANRPMKIENVVISDSISGNDIPIWNVSRQEYIELPNKSSTGDINQIWYDPQINLGKIHVWPITDSVDKYLTLWVQRTLEDFNTATDTPDFPQEWYLPLALNLASLSCTKYGVPIRERQQINSMARMYYISALSFDAEDGFQFQPDFRQ